MNLRTIKTKIVTLGVIGIVIMAVVLLAVTFSQRQAISKVLDSEFASTVQRETAATAKSTLLLCESQQTLLLKRVDHSLDVARTLLQRQGGFHLSTEPVSWAAVNQVTRQSNTVTLLKAMAGETWFGQNCQTNERSLLVDEVAAMAGGVCTVFQRMNDAGDMLRVCTNVRNQDGARAVGTFIPAVGTETDVTAPNPVVQALLRGETYSGMASVVGSWHLASYEPLFDQNRRVVGALFVGVPRDEASSLGQGIRQGIMSTKVGKTGYVYILGGKGAQRGRYLVSQHGKRDGENIWEAKDSDGKAFIQAIVGKATALKEGEVAYQRYPWLNPGEAQARNKVAAFTYFAPWDWIICSGAYEDDFADTKIRTLGGLNRMVKLISGTALVLCLSLGLFAFCAATSISNPIQTGVKLLAHISEGDLTNDVPDALQRRRDEIGLFGRALAKLTTDLRISLTGVSNSTSTLAIMSDGLLNLAKRMNARSRETAEKGNSAAAAAEEASANTVSVAASIEQASTNLANVASATEQMSATIADVASNAAKAREVSENAGRQAEAVGVIVQELGRAAQEIGKVTETIAGISEQTKLLALNATIEAARAGAAGKGFAVVAHEIKELARQTATATDDIKAKVSSVQSSTSKAIEDIQKIAGVSQDVRNIVTTIAAAIEEQATVTRDVASNISQASSGVRDANERVAQTATVSKTIAKDISAISIQTKAVSDDGVHLDEDANLLQGLSKNLQELVSRFDVGAQTDFGAIKKGHMQWRSRLVEMMEGRATLRATDVADHHQCALGQWCDGDGQQFRNAPSFARLGECHESFHSLVAEIVRHWNQGETAAARRSFEQLIPLTEEIFARLDALSLELASNNEAEIPIPDISIVHDIAA